MEVQGNVAYPWMHRGMWSMEVKGNVVCRSEGEAEVNVVFGGEGYYGIWMRRGM